MHAPDSTQIKMFNHDPVFTEIRMYVQVPVLYCDKDEGIRS